MEHKTLLRGALIGLLVVSFVLPVSAQNRSRRGGLYGDWNIKMQFGQGEIESILAFSRNQEGQYTGQWISAFVGVTELDDVKFEDNNLSFTHVMRWGDQEITSKFTGTVDLEQRTLKGVLVNDRGESDITGKRPPRMSRGVGNWDMKIQAGEREYTGTLTITADEQGKLKGMWKSDRGEAELLDVKYQREERKLTYTRVIERNGNRMELAFAGTVGYRSLEGTYKAGDREVPATGTRIGAAIMGTWNLDITGEQRSYKQRLRVNPDMSALYGSTPIKKINLDGDKVSFKYSVQFGDQEFEVSFAGQVAESKLTGELTHSRGTSKVTGARRQYGRSRSSRN